MTDSARRAWTPEQRRFARQMLPYLEEIGWIESRQRRESVDRHGSPIPWLTYPALAFLDERVGAEMSVFEFGGGNSTLWWAQRARKVTTVEHDAVWAAKLAETIPPNVQLKHVPLVPGADYSHHARNTGEAYDVIVIDGRDRVNCALASVESLRRGGVIVWDNSERRRYEIGLRHLRHHGFRRIRFAGLAPIGVVAGETSVLYRPENCLGI